MLYNSAVEAQPETRVSPGQIFVLGRNRSGTKWLTNQISNHPRVAAITAPNAGVLEANLFEHLPRMFGDLAINDHYYAFLAAFMKSSFFHRSGLPESWLYEQRHDDYLEFFSAFMDRLAQARGASHWLQKGSSQMFPVLLERFPDAKFIVMRREDVLANVRSSVALKGAGSAERNKLLLVARELASYYLHRAIELDHLDYPNVRPVTYERLSRDKPEVMREVCEYLELGFDDVVLEDAFPPNTSFGRTKPGEVFTPLDLRTFALLQPLFRSLPVRLLRGVHRLRPQREPRKGQRLLIAGAFRTFRYEVEALRSESAELGSAGLEERAPSAVAVAPNEQGGEKTKGSPTR